MHTSWIEITAENLCLQLDIALLFPNPAHPLEIDLGAGDGSFAIESASAHPKINFLAIERLKGRAAKIAKKTDRLGLLNLRVLRIDALYALSYLIPAGSVATLHLLFPDPWPKRRHKNNRILQEPFLVALKRVLIPNGFFHFATDDEPYWRQGLALLDNDATFQRTSPLRLMPLTDFEKFWIANGKTPRHAWWQHRL
jgi:tRNA (guanine-N7-)-methyltransferase